MPAADKMGWMQNDTAVRLESVNEDVLPVHYQISGVQRAFSAIALALASVAVVALAYRVATHVDLIQWWVPIALVGGLVAADFGSGLVHWGADTWGRDDLPIVGKLLLVPFRVHHVNPDDFARRSFVDTNGEVAAIALLVVAALLLVPLNSTSGAVTALFGLAFCGVGMLTNQIHQWAHVDSVPTPVRWLQRLGLLLGPADHACHHAHPYDVRYCITTGWCNRPLEAIGFYRRLESVITHLTGALPRHDDRNYESRYGRFVNARD
jgi:plasmanylethanolamine desaturase